MRVSPQRISAGKMLKDLSEHFKIGGQETSLRKHIKVIVKKYCGDAFRLPEDEGGE